MYVKNSIKKLERIFEKLENFYQDVKLNTIAKIFLKRMVKFLTLNFFAFHITLQMIKICLTL